MGRHLLKDCVWPDEWRLHQHGQRPVEATKVLVEPIDASLSLEVRIEVVVVTPILGIVSIGLENWEDETAEALESTLFDGSSKGLVHAGVVPGEICFLKHGIKTKWVAGRWWANGWGLRARPVYT